MSERYKVFIRELKRYMLEQDLTVVSLARVLNRNHTTVYNWLGFKNIMSGEDMLEILEKIMDRRIG
jgi:hypothetical protein